MLRRGRNKRNKRTNGHTRVKYNERHTSCEAYAPRVEQTNACIVFAYDRVYRPKQKQIQLMVLHSSSVNTESDVALEKYECGMG